ncbi:MAG: CoA transferase [Actinobacteria bacterium]|nr:CoA transferase [Actinomycetota bacterium]
MHPCEHLRVIDFSEQIAGPYSAKLLADLGADVIKVERRDGDPLRRWTACDAPVEPGTLFDFLNQTKRGTTLDDSTAAGRDALAELAGAADVIIESCEASSTFTGALALKRLQVENPRLSIVTVSPFGLSGPRSGAPATEFTLQAYCGSIVRGPDDQPPLQAGGRIGEWAAGAFAAIAAIAAVRSARRSGRGEHIDVSMLECMALTFNPYPTVQRSFLGTDDPGPRKREIPSIVAARDGWVGFCTVTGQQWEDFLLLIDRADLLADDGLRLWASRVQRYDEVLATIEASTTQRSVEQILELAEMFRVPAAPVGTGATIAGIDHFVERGVYQLDPTDRFLQPRSPLILHGAERVRPTPAPDLIGPRSITWDPRHLRPAPTPDRDPAPGDPAPRGLDGIRVLDLTAFWAGPMAAQCLAALGADVVKVESVQRPDPMRYHSVASPSDPLWYEKGSIYQGANVGKRGITLDLSRPVGRQLLLGLIRDADVLIENFTPRVLDHFGLDWAALHDVNPRLIMVRMPAFGLDGPWQNRGGFAQTMEQVSGMASVTGHLDGPPLIPSGPCDVLAGTHAVVALLAALEQRDRTGHGQLVEVPMVEVALNVAAELVLEHSRHGTEPGRHGNRGPGAAPQGLYECGELRRLVAIAVETSEQWHALTDLMQHDDGWLALPELATLAGRRIHHDRIDDHIRRWLAPLDVDTALDLLRAAGVPAAPVVGAGHIARDGQLQARGFFQPIEHPIVGTHQFPGLPMRPVSGAPRWFSRPAPLLGQHTVEVLTERLGLTGAELTSLTADAVIGTAPRGAS